MAKWKAQFRYSTAPGDPEKYPYLVSADITQAGRIIGAATVRPDLPAEKNAHLMAAAPDLLEALQAVLDAVEPWDIPDGVYGKAEHAIAKAKGEV